jgi:predicted ferric reductase
MKRYIGIFIIVIILIITFSLWYPLKTSENFSDIISNARYWGQITALLGLVLFAIEFVLATRASFLEIIFGGLDKLYTIHHIVGGLALILLMNHPILLALHVLPNINVALMYFWLGSNFAYNLGVIALYILLILLVITFYFKLPYDLWKSLHEWLGVPIIFAALHIILISSDTSNSILLRVWILSWCGIAIIAYLYKRFLYKYLGKSAEYTVEKVVKMQEIVEVYLKPVRKPLKFKPGQFAFVSFLDKRIGNEAHPYSISYTRDGELIRFSIKALGDYTLKLRELSVGSKAIIYGPFGKFFDKSYIKKNDEIWIAGGIGVTPFLSMLHERNINPVSKNTTFYYCSKTLDEALYNNEITEATKGKTNFNYVNFCASTQGYISAKIIADQHNGQIKDKLIFICGPKPLMDSLNTQFLNMGVKQSNIIFEEFNFKP